jgi:septal ring factor EnvC (AmiA/AmiB activator)
MILHRFRWAGTLLFCCAFTIQAAQAAKPTERSRQKILAENARAELVQKLSALKTDITRTEAAKEQAVDILAESEAAISDSSRVLRDLMSELRQTEERLKRLTAERAKLTLVVTQQQTQLSRLLRQHYVAGKEDRIKLLLSGDNPNRIERDLQYMGYLSQAQAAMLANLRANLAAVEQNQAQTQNIQEELAEIGQEQREQKAVLEQEKTKRAALLASLSKKLTEQRKQADNLTQDERRMGALVSKLTQLIEEQAAEQRRLADQRLAQQRLANQRVATERAEQQAKAAKLAEQQATQRKTQRETQRETQRAQAAASKPLADEKANAANPETGNIVADAAPSSLPGLKNEQIPSANEQGGNFASLRGKLHLPLRGTIQLKFAGKRAEGPNSKGLFIRAAEGTEVKAVASGRVLFAEWLRGFGNLLIVDHGDKYMTIYGNNQSLLKRAGDPIKNGDTIAYAGNSGGNEESGLYFEMRHQGRAFDPLSWVTIK